MPARTHTRTPSPSAGVGTRLPWWALALPVAAFVTLLLLIAGPAGAPAGGGDPSVAHVLEEIRRTLPG
ncbi:MULTISPECIES: hypothetical protein [Streptomyces]|uniref:hypothetical protein n=1 Tax=Streptomyces TaxID=1883 RepID=UPI001319B6CD|nr:MULTISPECIES: hypothetical protein [Streptomyces]QGZ48276.1 hypothetical protein GPZ77_07640 [Streptomyces sp. QHH-9511]GGT66579.1 hypothetical protein GCM10010272_06530 [Streptomyces lateritius]